MLSTLTTSSPSLLATSRMEFSARLTFGVLGHDKVAKVPALSRVC